MRRLGEGQLDDLAVGAAVLGTGGGGNPYLGALLVKQVIREHGPVELVTVDEVPDDALVGATAGMGAPTVGGRNCPVATSTYARCRRCSPTSGGRSPIPSRSKRAGRTRRSRSGWARNCASRSLTLMAWGGLSQDPDGDCRLVRHLGDPDGTGRREGQHRHYRHHRQPLGRAFVPFPYD